MNDEKIMSNKYFRCLLQEGSLTENFVSIAHPNHVCMCESVIVIKTIHDH